MNLRLASIDDLESIVAIYNQAITAGQRTADTVPATVSDRLDWFNAHVPEARPVYVAEKNGDLLGYLTLSSYRPGREALRHTAEVSFFVHFDYHRQGIGAGLLEHAIRACPSLEIKTLFAILMESNHGSIQLLENFGFEKWGHMPNVADYDGVEVGHLYYGLRVR